MFENCKDKNELRAEAKGAFVPLLNKMDEHVSDLIYDTAIEEAALVGVNATANRIKDVCEAYINKAEELEKQKKDDLQENYNDFNYGFLLGMFFAEVMRDK